jgi:AcrR family transcriptional regulator
LRTSTRLFAEKSYYGVGIRQICRETNMTSASLYHYAQSKQDLLERIMLRVLERLHQLAVTATPSSETPLQHLVRIVEMSVLIHALNPMSARVVDKEVPSLGRDARKRVVEARDRYEDVWRRVIESGIAEGYFRSSSATLPRIAILSMCAEIAYWYRPDGSLNLQTITREFVDMALALVGADLHEAEMVFGLTLEDFAKFPSRYRFDTEP